MRSRNRGKRDENIPKTCSQAEAAAECSKEEDEWQTETAATENTDTSNKVTETETETIDNTNSSNLFGDEMSPRRYLFHDISAGPPLPLLPPPGLPPSTSGPFSDTAKYDRPKICSQVSHQQAYQSHPS